MKKKKKKTYGGISVKKFKKIAYIILVIIILVLAYVIYSNATKIGEDNQKEKTISEIRYLDTKFVDLFNSMNNIQTRNYKIYTAKIEESRSEESTNTSSNNSDSSGGGSSSQDSSGGSSSGGDSGQSSGNSNSSQNSERSEMKPSGILTENESIDWNSVKNELELIYTSISTITMDLYQMDIKQDDILNFNKSLDDLTVSVKSENKQDTLNNLAKVYSYIPKFTEKLADDVIYKTVIKTKENIFNAYSKLDLDDWDGMKNDITEAIKTYETLLTSANIETNKQASINKAYIMLNELQNAINLKDKQVFLIKYKNLLEEINNM